MPATTDDDSLLSAWHARQDAEAFRHLCERYAGLVEAACRRQRSPDPAEAVQAVFLVLARRAGSVASTSLGAWLTSTAMRVVRNQHRAAASRRHHEREAGMEHARHRTSEADAAEGSAWTEARQHLDAALASLSTRRREAVLRFYLQSKSQAEIAAELDCSVPAVKSRVHEGLEGLRSFFARRGIALGTTALASCLASEAAASDPMLVAASVHAAIQPASAPASAALAAKVHTAMIIKTTSLIAAGLLVAGSCLGAAVALGAEPAPRPAPLAPSGHAAPAALVPQAQPGVEPIVTPRASRAQDAFAAIRAAGGPRVRCLGDAELSRLFIPAAMRFKPVKARSLIEAVARDAGLKIRWSQQDKIAVLYRGAADADIAVVKRELASPDAGVRSAAAWRCGWLKDPRIIPLLVASTQDADAGTARQALASLRRLSWSAAVALDALALQPMASGLTSPVAGQRLETIRLLGDIGGERAIQLLATVLADADVTVRISAVRALGDSGEEKAAELLGTMLSDQSEAVRDVALFTLGDMPGVSAFPILEQVVAGPDGAMRGLAARMLGQARKDKALPLLAPLLADTDANTRWNATLALGHVSAAKSLPLLKVAAADPDKAVRQAAADSLGAVGGAEAVALLQQLLADPITSVRCYAATALGKTGEPAAVPLLTSVLNDPPVRWYAVVALAAIDGDAAQAALQQSFAMTLADPAAKQQLLTMARSAGDIEINRILGRIGYDLLQQGAADPDASVRALAISAVGEVGGPQALLAIERAMGDAHAAVRVASMQALASGGSGNRERQLALCTRALSDPAGEVREAAARALGRAFSEPPPQLLSEALRDPEPRVRSEATSLLEEVGTERALALLRQMLADQAPAVRSSAAETMAHLGGDAARETLLSRLASEPQGEVRKAIHNALRAGYAGDPVVEQALGKAASDAKTNPF